MSTLSLTPPSVSSGTVVSTARFKIQPQFEEAIHNTLGEAVHGWSWFCARDDRANATELDELAAEMRRVY